MFLTAVGGIATGILALMHIHAEPHRYRGKGLAIAGIVLSVLGPLSYVILIVLFGALSFLPVLMP